MVRNIYILLLLSLSYSATLLVPEEYSTIQSAIDAASDGDSVLVSAGTYLENINFNGKNIVVIGEDRETTIIDGGHNGSVVTFDSIEGTASALSNFTITGGNAYDGGGIYCSSSAPTIKDNIITGNVSETYGGGISCNYSSPIIMNNTITSNSAIYGGGISFDRYTSSVIKGNNINGNSAEEGGGIGCFTFSSPTITNNTIAGNSASTNGGGIYCYYISSPSVTNTIIWDNTAPTDPNISVYFSDPFFNYSDIEGGWEGDGNIDADPLFCDPENGDLTVQSDSPVLGAGQDGADMGAYGVGCEPDDVCSACNIYYTDGYPGFCCDMAWDEGGLTCLYVEAEWGLDCGGCNCFGDLAFCEEQGLMMCSDYSCAESLSQCPPECDLGDVNCDGVLNILDIVIASYTILDNEYTAIGDVNGDGELNILDLVIMVNWVLYGMSDNTDIDWVSIPAGIYTYGQFDAILSIDYDYQISKYEITNAQYVTYLEDALASGDINVLIGSVLGYYPGDEENAAGDYIYLEIIDEHSQIIYDGISFSIVDGYEDHPVVEVSWFGANAFAEHYGWRLPDEYEWEKAARGDTGYDYPFGNSMNGSQANYYDSGDPYEQGEWSDWPNTSPVGFYNGQNNDGFVTTDSPSPYGVYDMAGNVWEYTGSWYFDGSPLRVRRGGSWYVGLTSGWCRSWLRDGNTPAGTYYDIGFRVARTN